MPGLGGIRNLVKLCGKAKAMELVLQGQTFDAEEALENNLVDEIVPRKEVLDHSIDVAKKILKNYRLQKKPLYLKQIRDREARIR
jgi:enoyl-CoA hydratase/carnithine racemase